MKNILEKKIKKVIEKVQPFIRMHGGDVLLVGVKDGVVTLQISGACAHCSLANLTYNEMIGGLLKKEVPEVKKIVIIK